MDLILDIVIFWGKILRCFLEFLIYKIIFKKKKNVVGEIVFIIGVVSGFGRLMVIKFVSFGVILVLWDINEEGNIEICRLVKEKGDVKVFVYKCDCINR